MVTAKREPGQEEPKLSKIPPWGPLRGPQGGVLDSFGFFDAAIFVYFWTFSKVQYTYFFSIFRGFQEIST